MTYPDGEVVTYHNNAAGQVESLTSNKQDAALEQYVVTRPYGSSYKITDELKNIAQVEHSRHRCFDKFIVNLLGAIAAYCLFPKKPCINVQRTIDTQLALF